VRRGGGVYPQVALPGALGALYDGARRSEAGGRGGADTGAVQR
jgi:hypothetical protein